MPISLTSIEDGNTVRITATLDQASSGNVAFAIDARMTLVNANFAGQNQVAPGSFDPTNAVDNGAGIFATEATFSGPLSAGQELFSYEFTKIGPGSIQVSQYLVLINEGPGSLSEPADLISVTFDGGTVQTPTPGDDVLTTLPQSDAIDALAGDDLIMASSGADTIDGGPGTDTLALNGPRDAYTLTISTTGTNIVDRRDGGDGANVISNIELLTFEGTAAADPLDLTKFGGAATLSAEEFETIIELYIAYFNRAPDALGLNFWSTAFADGLPLQDMANLFATQPETMMTYPDGTSNTAFAEAVYSNVLGRDPDAAGLAFWVGQLEAATVSRAQFILEILAGAKAAPPAGASQDFIDQQLADIAYLDSKTDVGAYYAVHNGLSDTDNARSVMETYGASDVMNELGARDLTDQFSEVAFGMDNGEFTLPIVGIIVDDLSGVLS